MKGLSFYDIRYYEDFLDLRILDICTKYYLKIFVGQFNVLQKQKIFLSTLLDSIADNFVFLLMSFYELDYWIIYSSLILA
jgi:hypothetical protein